VRKRGQKVESVGGIARKAIEEGWKPQDSIIEIEYETQKKIATQEAVIKKQQEESQEADTRKRRAVAMSRYESMTEGEKGAFLSYFREYLVATDNRIVLKRYDETGVTPGMVEGMLTFFILERLGEVAVVSE
jgi:hypothetical protein